MLKTAIYAYKNGSQSAKLLKEALGVPLLKHEGKAIEVETVINWGSGSLADRVVPAFIINGTFGVNNAANKLNTFREFERFDVPTVEWTDDQAVADDWYQKGIHVFARTVLNGHSGVGIVSSLDIPDLEEWKALNCKLWTKYSNKKEEYRIHVFGRQAIHVQRKARKKDVPDDKVNWKIRNHANGFIFQIQGVEVPDEANEVAIKAVAALGLDFGAVDIIYTTDRKWLALEVNTAPGIEGTTLNKYVEAFQKVL